MTPQLQQVSNWMQRQHRTVRFAPSPVIPPLERSDAITYIEAALQSLAQATHVSAHGGLHRTANTTAKVVPVDVLTALTVLHAQVLAAYHTYGFPAAEAQGVYQLTRDNGKPDMKKALETFYPSK